MDGARLFRGPVVVLAVVTVATVAGGRATAADLVATLRGDSGGGGDDSGADGPRPSGGTDRSPNG